MKDFYIVQPIIVVFGTITLPAGIFLTLRIGSKAVIIIVGVTCLTLLAISSFVTNPFVFIIMYAVAFGTLKGFGIAASLIAGWSHLPHRKGFVSGFIQCGQGCGGFIFGFLTGKLINPNNVKA